MPNDLLAKRLRTVFWFISLLAIAFPVHGESATIFGKKGPYQVTMSEVADQGILLVPHAADGSTAKKTISRYCVRPRSLRSGTILLRYT